MRNGCRHAYTKYKLVNDFGQIQIDLGVELYDFVGWFGWAWFRNVSHVVYALQTFTNYFHKSSQIRMTTTITGKYYPLRIATELTMAKNVIWNTNTMIQFEILANIFYRQAC